jgi:tetratricopeptide (TPR) repeat protein
MIRSWAFATGQMAMLLFLFGAIACAGTPRKKNTLAYSADSFQTEIQARVPELSPTLSRPPFVVDDETIERARAMVMAAPRGPKRVQALVDFLTVAKPEGLGLVYDWSATGSAASTIERGSGNCVALASVLVGLGRGLKWPIYYAEARTRRPETQEFEEVKALSDHMAVIVVAKTVQMIVDFTGLLDEAYSVHPIDDLTAYAHIVNNFAAQAVMTTDSEIEEAAWKQAISGFDLATRIQPNLGRAWNNKGIALSKLGRFDEAREAYRHAVELDTAFGSAKRNLTLMETRALGDTQILENGVPQGEK